MISITISNMRAEVHRHCCLLCKPPGWYLHEGRYAHHFAWHLYSTNAEMGLKPPHDACLWNLTHRFVQCLEISRAVVIASHVTLLCNVGSSLFVDRILG